METDIKSIEERANRFFNYLSTYYDHQEAYNQDLIREGMEGNPFGKEFTQKIAVRDADVSSRPYKVAKVLLEDLAFDSRDVQRMLDLTTKFKGYSPDLFGKYGVFLTEMIRKVIAQNPRGSIVLNTGNKSPPLKRDFFVFSHGSFESSFPFKFEEMEEYQRDNLLIGHLIGRLGQGNMVVNGNVGNFFATENCGANLTLNGNCGWRSGYGMVGGNVEINGDAGHDLAEGLEGGIIHVKGNISSLNSLYTDAWGGEIYQNGRLIPKKKVLHREN
jgi:hypothetical protein